MNRDHFLQFQQFSVSCFTIPFICRINGITVSILTLSAIPEKNISSILQDLNPLRRDNLSRRRPPFIQHKEEVVSDLKARIGRVSTLLGSFIAYISSVASILFDNSSSTTFLVWFASVSIVVWFDFDKDVWLVVLSKVVWFDFVLNACFASTSMSVWLDLDTAVCFVSVHRIVWFSVDWLAVVWFSVGWFV